MGADWSGSDSYDSSTDGGYNITRPHSELSFMYYVNLGLIGNLLTDRRLTANFWGIWQWHGRRADECSLVKHLQSYVY